MDFFGHSKSPGVYHKGQLYKDKHIQLCRGDNILIGYKDWMDHPGLTEPHKVFYFD